MVLQYSCIVLLLWARLILYERSNRSGQYLYDRTFSSFFCVFKKRTVSYSRPYKQTLLRYESITHKENGQLPQDKNRTTYLATSLKKEAESIKKDLPPTGVISVIDSRCRDSFLCINHRSDDMVIDKRTYLEHRE